MKCSMSRNFPIFGDNFEVLRKSLAHVFKLQKSSIFLQIVFMTSKLGLQFLGLYLINRIFTKLQMGAKGIHGLTLLQLILSYILCVFLSELITNFCSKYFIQFVDIPKFDYKIKENVQKLCLNANAEKFENHEINHFVFQCSFSGTNIYRMVEVFFNQIEVTLSFLILYLFFAKIDYTYAMVLLLLFIPICASNILKTKQHKKSRAILNKIDARENEFFKVCSNPDFAKENKIMHINAFLISKLQSLTHRYKELLRIENKKYFTIDLITETAKILCNSLALFLALTQLHQRQNIGEIIILIQGYRILNTGMVQFFELNTYMNMFSSMVKPYFNIIRILDHNEEEPEKALFQNSMEFNGISFQYPNANEPSVSDVSLTIRKGEKIALVGPNGSGKTTLSKIILQLVEPTSGQIKIDGRIVPRNELNFQNNSWKNAMFQEFCKYPLTVRENIQISDCESNNQRDVAAILKDLDFDIDQNTSLGMSLGNRDLSGGQWQRLALGRLIYRDKNLIILDEPTSEIDPVFENKIFELVKKYFHDKTLIVITHSLKSVQDVDKVVLLNHGKIAAVNTHEQLLDKSPLYKKIWMSKVSAFEKIK